MQQSSNQASSSRRVRAQPGHQVHPGSQTRGVLHHRDLHAAVRIHLRIQGSPGHVQRAGIIRIPSDGAKRDHRQPLQRQPEVRSETQQEHGYFLLRQRVASRPRVTTSQRTNTGIVAHPENTNICIAFVQCWTSGVGGPTLYKCYTSVFTYFLLTLLLTGHPRSAAVFL